MTRARTIADFGDGIATADIGDGQITTAKIADGDVTSAKLFSGFANGITQADLFRLTADKSSNGDITANLERADDSSSGLIGSGMSESSGIFTFPSTGIYLVTVVAEINNPGGADNTFIAVAASLDGGSTYDNAVEAATGSDGTLTQLCSSCLVDVTNTSNVKLKFSVSSLAAGSALKGDTGGNRTFLSFIRLGDT